MYSIGAGLRGCEDTGSPPDRHASTHAFAGSAAGARGRFCGKGTAIWACTGCSVGAQNADGLCYYDIVRRWNGQRRWPCRPVRNRWDLTLPIARGAAGDSGQRCGYAEWLRALACCMANGTPDAKDCRPTASLAMCGRTPCRPDRRSCGSTAPEQSRLAATLGSPGI